MTTDFDAVLSALRTSAALLRETAMPLDDAALVERAYPSEWTIADVLSHLGSGAAIFHRRLNDALTEAPTPDDFAKSVWDTWDAKSPRQQADDALAADEALVEALGSVDPEAAGRLRFAGGAMQLDIVGFAGLRLNEHCLHTWDIRVVSDPTEVVPPDAAAVAVDNLDLIARFSAKPTGAVQTITVATTSPTRTFRIDLAAEGVTFGADPHSGATPDLELPAEAFVRLVYGRLDPDHTPAAIGNGEALTVLRKVFPGP